MCKLSTVVITVAVLIGSASANEFTVDFEWGDTPHCNTGSPSRVANPVFVLGNVPDRTTTIKFKMRDLDALTYNHGGGKVSYSGDDIIPSGSFRYKGPCPPRQVHNYRWTATALDVEGDELGKASATRSYPE